MAAAGSYSIPTMKELFGNDPTRNAADRQFEGASAGASSLKDCLRRETVLVTGAGGSLGRALARRLAALPLERLLLVDTSEHGLVRLNDTLRVERGSEVPSDQPSLSFVLADLRTESGRARALRRKPTTVLHAAAYKHVPFLETRPIAAAENNLVATADWLQACRKASVEQFVLVSTDKAVRPVGVMGRTKAGTERLLRVLRRTPTPGLTAQTVRLCNVFGSRGSVVPRFCRRLRQGQPLEVTDPAMERQYLSAEEAAEAVVQVLRHEAGTYVPRAGRSLTVGDIADRLLRWGRPAADPDEWIRVVGRRAGERDRERLVAPEEQPAVPVKGPKVSSPEGKTPVLTAEEAPPSVRENFTLTHPEYLGLPPSSLPGGDFASLRVQNPCRYRIEKSSSCLAHSALRC